MTDYDTRATQYGFASKEDILKTVKESTNVVLLDVRNPTEIAETGPLKAGDHATYVVSSCTPDAAPELEEKAEQMMPDKEAPIVIYCRSGRRAAKAEEVLKSKGYSVVMNAGGFDDIDYLKV